MKKFLSIFIFIGLLATVNATETEKKTEEVKVEEVDARFKGYKDVDKDLLTEANGNYTLESPFVISNPYGLSPLTAVVIFNTTDETTVSVKVKGNDESTDIVHKYDTSSKKHMVPVYGLYANKENEIVIETTTKDGKTATNTIKIKTEALPDDFSKFKIVKNDKAKMINGLTFFDCPHTNGNYFFGIDANGDVRWYLNDKSFNGSVMLTHLENGNFLIGSGQAMPKSYNNLYKVFEVSPLGRYENEYHVYGIHHDIRERKNGNLIFAASKEGRESQNDYIVELDRNTGKIIREWDLMEIIPMTKYDTKPPYTGGLSNWLHNNGVWYLEDEDAFVISGRHQNMIAKFGATDKKLKWVFSGTVAKENEKLQPYMLKFDANMEYPFSQHAAMIAPDGKLLVFDNRNDIEKTEPLKQDLLYSRAVAYEVDEKNMTIKEVWEYGKKRGKELYSSFVSDVDCLGKDHYLINFGGMYIADNGDSYDHIFTKKEIKNASNRNTIVIEILNDEVVFEVVAYGNSNSNTYKVERKNIYKNAKELDLK
ncbi:aryl-sulfate sulfotransferase [Fusobacterium sp. PH5-44]|uniref:aryl-sulfate sulfotransferase n=1 Tax=unclassified Fusobacterium TaxID=2648384 RepID=UPI003D1D7530